MRKLFTLLMILLITGGMMAQQTKSVPGKRKCGTMESTELLKQQDPTYAARLQAMEEFTQNYIANHPQEMDKAVITIPVVVHMVYNTTAQNLSDSRVNEQIAVLNADYAGLNTHGMQLFNTSLKVNTELQFCLAQVDPTGAATTGIERRSTTTTSFSYSGNGVKYYSSGGLDQWDPHNYMNIWVCNLSGGLCGYAEFPTANLSATFGVVIHYQYFGKTGASAPYNLGGTTTHEIGHCFNLYHIWGDDSGACTGTDYCTDTPNQADCTYGTHTGLLTDACTTTTPGIMYMNFMDYSDDASYSNFTPNQKARITAIFASGDMHTLSLSTKCTGSSTLSANFTANVTTVNVGGQVTFTSNCTGSPTSYTWTFTGGTPATATGIGPHTITYNTAGTYNAALTVSNGTTSDTETKTSYITVTSCSTSGYFLNFECNTDFDITFSPWTVNDVDLSATYGIEDASSNPYVFLHSGEAMSYLAFNPASTVPTLSADAELQPHGGVRFGACMNASTPPNNDWLISPKVQLGTGSSFTMWVKTYVNTWGLERISTGTYEEAPITWTQKTYSLASYNNQQVYVGINCSSNDAFIFMVDDINIATTLTGMNVVPEVQQINVFPNPASESAYVDITSVGSKDVNIELYDMFGKLQNAGVSTEATNLKKIDLTGLSKGIYVAKISTPLGEKIEKLVVY
jgi:PKD repeat protein